MVEICEQCSQKTSCAIAPEDAFHECETAYATFLADYYDPSPCCSYTTLPTCLGNKCPMWDRTEQRCRAVYD